MITDWNKATELATNENKKILIILTGSEWCAPCKKMENKVIANKEFQEYAKQNFIIFLIDLPGGGLIMNSKVHQDYQKFKKKYETNFLPSLIITKNDGTKIKLLKGKMFHLDNIMQQLKS